MDGCAGGVNASRRDGNGEVLARDFADVEGFEGKVQRSDSGLHYASFGNAIGVAAVSISIRVFRSQVNAPEAAIVFRWVGDGSLDFDPDGGVAFEDAKVLPGKLPFDANGGRLA